MTPTLPFVTSELPGFGGHLKAEPGYFQVEEIPLYEPAGQGEHLYVVLTREGWNTRQVAEALAKHFSLPVRSIGFAGLKDRHARSTQTFSLPGLAPEDARSIESSLPFDVHKACLHRNKLKTGHLLGNRFQITVTHLDVAPPEALARAREVAEAVARRGVPNFFGAQRFGIDGGNVSRGRDALLGGGPHRDQWLRRLLISAYQSHLFNIYLARRMTMGLFDRLLPGDIAKKADTGGMFEIADVSTEQPRYQRGEITFTGPIYGRKMWAAKDMAGELEATILEEAGLTTDDFRKARIEGTRRPGRLWLPAIDLAICDNALQLSFTLPKGAYATVVVREFTKVDAGAHQLAYDESEDQS